MLLSDMDSEMRETYAFLLLIHKLAEIDARAPTAVSYEGADELERWATAKAVDTVEFTSA